VPATSVGLSRLFFLFFLRWPLTVLMKQARQAVSAFKKSILLRCLWCDATTPHEKVASMSADINACLDSALVKSMSFL
jgi:hypothetical protein